MNNHKTDDKVAIIAKSCGYTSSKRYIARAQFLFSDLDLAAKDVLEVGCGRGAWALWAGICRASYVLGVEPESTGSTPGFLHQFQNTIDDVGFTNHVEGKGIQMQDLDAEGAFDIIMAYDVINHFSESHTRTLHLQLSRKFYIAIFQHIYRLLKPGGVFIIADSSQHNFFGDLRLTNPLSPAIVWNIHQAPECWLNIAREAGFKLRDIRWSYIYPFTRITIKAWMAYFLASHFVLRVQKT